MYREKSSVLAAIKATASPLRSPSSPLYPFRGPRTCFFSPSPKISHVFHPHQQNHAIIVAGVSCPTKLFFSFFCAVEIKSQVSELAASCPDAVLEGILSAAGGLSETARQDLLKALASST